MKRKPVVDGLERSLNAKAALTRGGARRRANGGSHGRGYHARDGYPCPGAGRLKLIDRYVLREALPPFLFGLVLYASLAEQERRQPFAQHVAVDEFQAARSRARIT